MPEKARIEKPEDLHGDLAGRYRATTSTRTGVDTDLIEADLAAFDADGYVVIDGLIPGAVCTQIAAQIDPLLGPTGRNVFEGHRTRRVYSLLTKTRIADRLVEHPRILALLDRLLMPNYLLSQLQAISIGPQESAQLLHYDDGMYPVPRPRPALSAATIWAITDFTADNGATVAIPGSHRWDDHRTPNPADERVSIAMPAGSVVFFAGTLWHGGGANRTHDQRRLAITAQYCQPWLRPQEAFTLSTPPATARAVSADIRAMLGYSIHPPFVGMVDGMHPLRLLDSSV
jgi:ectoine hydroxylase-related dioxygenase (phytanoyl-CoA dioxygenase family)